jgi:SAM-dependent methyltransferase
MWILIESLMRRFAGHLPWQVKYLCGKAGVGGMDISIDRHFEYAFVIGRLKDRKRGMLVDVGGTGSLLSTMLAALGYDVVGYDLHPWSLKFPRYEHRVGDACHMQLEDSMVEVCVSISCIEHMGGKRYGDNNTATDRLFMEEVLRILRPGGSLIISMPYGTSQELPSHRVYDEEQVKKLTDGFIELYREIYVPSSDKDQFHYIVGSEEAARIKRPWFRYSVIALELQKRDDRAVLERPE